jgi:hypothetical protein
MLLANFHQPKDSAIEAPILQKRGTSTMTTSTPATFNSEVTPFFSIDASRVYSNGQSLKNIFNNDSASIDRILPATRISKPIGTAPMSPFPSYTYNS